MLESRYRLLAVSFRESERGELWSSRLGDDLQGALDLLIDALGRVIALAPPDLDGEHVRVLMTEALPGLLGGEEGFLGALPDLVEDFLTWVAVEEGLATTWEWVSTVDSRREEFAAAVRDPGRPRLARPAERPDRRPAAKIGRNDPCPCGSGKKYKKCCLRLGD